MFQAVAGAHGAALAVAAGVPVPAPAGGTRHHARAALLLRVSAARVAGQHVPQRDRGPPRVSHLQRGGGPAARGHLDIRPRVPGQAEDTRGRALHPAADHLPGSRQVRTRKIIFDPNPVCC